MQLPTRARPPASALFSHSGIALAAHLGSVMLMGVMMRTIGDRVPRASNLQLAVGGLVADKVVGGLVTDEWRINGGLAAD